MNMKTQDFIHDDGGRAAAGYKGKTGDCAYRALAIAERIDYKEACRLIDDAIDQSVAKARTTKKKQSLATQGRKGGVARETLHAVLVMLGYQWVACSGIGRRDVVHLEPRELPQGRVICRVSRHFVAVIDGVVRDNHDCRRGGTRKVYGYWIKN